MKITIQYFDDCPNWQAAVDAVKAVAPSIPIELQLVDTMADAERFGFRGSPTILVDGRDPWADPDAPIGLSCRVFQTPSGLAPTPSPAQLADALSVRSQEHGAN